MASTLCLERKWLEEFGFSSMFYDRLTDEASENETTAQSSGHIWLSPQLQSHYTGRITDQLDNICLTVMLACCCQL